MAINLLDIYRNPNIGLFLKCNDKNILIPKGLTNTKIEKFSSYLGVQPIQTSIGGLRLIGSLVAMNKYGILVPRITEDEEINEIRKETNLIIERLPSKYTSIGNLIVVNDKGAIISDILTKNAIQLITDIFNVPVDMMNVSNYYQVGSIIVATNLGGVIHPIASECEIERISDTLKVDIEPSTVNSGIPYVSSGIIANSKNAIVGSHTTGPELAMLSRILKI